VGLDAGASVTASGVARETTARLCKEIV
jgi:hypothetical protein